MKRVFLPTSLPMLQTLPCLPPAINIKDTNASGKQLINNRLTHRTTPDTIHHNIFIFWYFLRPLFNLFRITSERTGNYFLVCFLIGLPSDIEHKNIFIFCHTFFKRLWCYCSAHMYPPYATAFLINPCIS